MKPSEVIREARNILFERGWHQGDLEGVDGSVCAAGALYCAAIGQPIPSAGNMALIHNSNEPFQYLIQALAPLVEGGVGSWNDVNGRTFDEVIDAFDRAEKIAEQREVLS